MKQYLIDELRREDYEALQNYFQDHFTPSGLDGLYWLSLETDLLSATQRAHTHCQPHYFAVELQPDRLSCEMLVRTPARVRCDCIAYADGRQRGPRMASRHHRPGDRLQRAHAALGSARRA